MRTFGTWLHGDKHGSVDRHGLNYFGMPEITENQGLRNVMKDEMKQASVRFGKQAREIVNIAVKEVWITTVICSML